MANKWISMPLNEGIDIVIDNRGKTPPYTNTRSPYELLEVNAITGAARKPDYSAVRKFVDETTYLTWFRKGHPQKGDVLFSTVGSIAEVAVSEERGSIAQNLIALRPKSELIDSAFLYYLLSNPQTKNRLLSLDISSVQPSIKVPHLLALQLTRPPLPTQRRIAAILGALDDKIELNRQMNDTLEQMAQAIFKSWFIDFDGQDDLVDSALGPVPRGWEVGRLGGVASEKRVTVQPQDISPDTPYIGLADMPQSSIALAEWGAAEDVTSAKIPFKRGDILFGKLRPYFKKVGVAPTDGICSSDMLVIQTKESHWYGFTLGLLTYDPFIDYTSAVSTGTRMPRVSWKAMADYKIALPPDELVNSFNEQIIVFSQRILSNIEESRTLADLRDTLLPKLISGELDVSDLDIELPDDIEEQVDKTKGTTDTTVTVPTAGGASDDEKSEEVTDDPDDAEKVSTAERPAPIDEWDTNDVMVVFRKVAREVGTVYRHEFVKAASRAMGYKRTGDKINNKLRNHMRAAVRRKILATEDQSVWLATPTMADYERDDLVDAVYAVMPLGRVLERAEVLDTVVYHLGFSRLTETVVTPIKSAIRHLVRVGALQVDGSTLERVWYKE